MALLLDSLHVPTEIGSRTAVFCRTQYSSQKYTDTGLSAGHPVIAALLHLRLPK